MDLVTHKQFTFEESSQITLELNRLLNIKAIEIVTDCVGQFVSPIFCVPKPDGSVRMILNLKQLNKFVNSEHFKLEDFRSVCNLLRSNMYMAKLDIQDAYLHIPVLEKHRKYLRFRFDGTLYQYLCLPFGLSCAPYAFTKILRPVCKYLRGKGFISSAYLDDLLLLGETEVLCRQNISVTTKCLENLGFMVNVKKSVLIPTKNLEYLGFNYDSREMSISLPCRKKDQLLLKCAAAKKWESVSIQMVAELQGLLISATPAVPYSLLYTRQIAINLASALAVHDQDYSAHMNFGSDCKVDLTWWLRKLPSAVQKIRSDKYDTVLFTDASLTGWGGACNGNEINGQWTVLETQMHINALELKAIEKCLHHFFMNKKKVSVLLRVDSITAIAYINKFGGCHSNNLHFLAKAIWQWCEQREIWLHCTYISSADNFIADFHSRISTEKEDWNLNIKYFEAISKKFGVPTIDLFATRHSRKCDRLLSWHYDPAAVAIDAFTYDWSGEFAYCFPPFCLIPRVLKKICSDKSTCILIVPKWDSQVWFPQMQRLVISSTFEFGPNNHMLECSFRKVQHPLRETLKLLAVIVSGKN